jgi:hypothetical protein
VLSNQRGSVREALASQGVQGEMGFGVFFLFLCTDLITTFCF